MIIKELERIEIDDSCLIAGRKAEGDVAFYLKRVFENRHDILVLHDLQLEYNGDAAQMDHLVLSRYGLIRARPENRERHSMLCSLRGQTPR